MPKPRPSPKQTKYKWFAYRIDDADRADIVELARLLERSKTDAVRFVVRQAVRELRAAAESQP